LSLSRPDQQVHTLLSRERNNDEEKLAFCGGISVPAECAQGCLDSLTAKSGLPGHVGNCTARADLKCALPDFDPFDPELVEKPVLISLAG
jgi:hypothetical protein